jgi:hypothetical protein
MQQPLKKHPSLANIPPVAMEKESRSVVFQSPIFSSRAAGTAHSAVNISPHQSETGPKMENEISFSRFKKVSIT